jgi:hypothetical protein
VKQYTVKLTFHELEYLAELVGADLEKPPGRFQRDDLSDTLALAIKLTRALGEQARWLHASWHTVPLVLQHLEAQLAKAKQLPSLQEHIRDLQATIKALQPPKGKAGKARKQLPARAATARAASSAAPKLTSPRAPGRRPAAAAAPSPGSSSSPASTPASVKHDGPLAAKPAE